MKRKMKVAGWIVFSILLCLQTQAQMLSLTAASTPVPGLYAGLRYSHYTNSEINLALGAFHEFAAPARLRYRASGLEALAEFQSARDPSLRFGWKAATGVAAQVESEPWVYEDYSFRQRLNYGLLAELGGMWNMTDAFALSLIAQQKFLLNKLLGSTHFLMGLQLHWRLTL